MKKFLSCIMALCLAASLSGFPVSALQESCCAPIVFVHGLGGWGEGAKLNEIFPHWGMMAGDVRGYLIDQGYEAYAASVSPVASVWDRACELYAHLTGTRTDYGEAHAKAHGHERFGQEYAPLGPDWPNERIHLIGHSFGGATIRLFAQLCAAGSAAERGITSESELSPLFSGTLGGRIVSVTTLAAPHNGTTALLEPVKGVIVSFIEIMLYAVVGMNELIPGFDKFYPADLQQFGRASNIAEIVRKTVTFSQSFDSATYDLSVDGAMKVNEGISCQPDIYYFSYAADMTRKTSGGCYIPKANISPMVIESSFRIGQKRGQFVTPGGVLIDGSWQPNDGLVNTVSALYPFGESYASYDAENIQPGVWQVMPVVKDWDHIDFGGGIRLGGAGGVMEFYLELTRMLEKLPVQ
ncbi:MAG: hypothetical protein FWF05_00520 [Oscillospiraceae bacterium]|nr:hypothetical protein [Oscillospiraceae bacterium]